MVEPILPPPPPPPTKNSGSTPPPPPPQKSIDPRVSQAFAVSRAGKDYLTSVEETKKRLEDDYTTWEQERIKQLQPLVKTDEDVKKYQALFDKEREAKIKELNASGQATIAPKFEAWKAVSSLEPLPNPNAPATPLSDMLVSGYSFITDQLPKSLLLNQLQSAPRKFEDIFSLAASAVNPIIYVDEYRQWDKTNQSNEPVAVKAFRFYQSLAPEQQQVIRDKVEARIASDRQGLMAKIGTQDKEAGEKMEMTGGIQSLEDVNSLKDFASLLGSLGGQTLVQIPLSVLTAGASSFLQERSAIYENQLDQLAAENDMTREEVIDAGLDDNSGLLGALAAAGLDYVGAKKVLNLVRAGGLRRLFGGGLEASTSVTQGVIEETSATAGENTKQTPGQAFKEAVATKEGLYRRGTAAVGGFLGGSVLAGASPQQKAKQQKVAAAIQDLSLQIDPKLVQVQDQMVADVQSGQLSGQDVQMDTTSGITTTGQTMPKINQDIDANQEQTTPLTIFDAIDKKAPVEINGVHGILQIDEGGKLTLESDGNIIELGNVDTGEVNVENDITTIGGKVANVMGQGGVKVPRKFTKITVNEETALRDQIKLEARAAKGGAKAMKTVLGKIADKINEIRGRVKLPKVQANSLLGRVANINLGSDLQVNRLLEYIDKLADGIEANIPYEQAARLRDKVKNNLGKIAAPQRAAIQELLVINPNELDNIQDYVDVLSDVEQFLKDPQKAINVAANAPKIAAIKETVRQNKIALAGELGITGVENYSTEQLDNLIAGVTEETDQFEDNADTTKKVARRDKVLEMLDYSLMALDDSDYAKALKKIDTENLTVSDILKVIRAAENYVTNGSVDGWVVAKQKAQEGVVATLKAKIDPNKLGLGSQTMGTTLFGMIKNLVQDAKTAAKMMAFSGMDTVQNKVAEAVAMTAGVEKRLEEKVKAIFGKQSTEEARKMIVRQGVLDIIIPVYADEDVETQYRENLTKAEEAFKRGAELADHEDVKKNNEAALGYLNELEGKGIATREALLNLIKDSKDWKLYQYRVGEMRPLDAKLKESTETYHNKTYRGMLDYAGKAAVYTLKSQDVPDLKGRAPVYGDRPTKVTMAESAYERKSTLAPNQVYTLNSLVNFVNGYQDVMTDVLATPARIQAREYFKDPRLNLGEGGSTIKEYFWGIDNFLVNGESFSGYAASVKRSKAYQVFNRYSALFLSTFKTALLSGPWRYLLQAAPQLSRLAIELGGDVDLLFKARALLGATPKPEIFDKVPLGIRAAMTGGTTFDDKEFRFNESGLNTAIDNVEVLTGKLNNFNRGSLAGQTLGDLAAARMVWLSNYLKYLRDNNVDINTIDLAAEHQQEGREEAIAYANGVTNIIAGPSQRGELSPFLRTTDPTAKIFKNLFFFMGAFPLVQQSSTNQAVSTLLKGTNKKQALKDLSGVFAENTTYAALSVALGVMAEGAGRALMDELGVGYEDKEDDEKDYLKRILAQGAFDTVPLTMVAGNISSGYLEIQFNKLLYFLDDTDKSYAAWSKAGGGLQGRYGTIGAEDQYISLAGPYLGAILKEYEAIKTIVAIDKNNYKINNKKYYLTDAQANTLYLISMMDFVSSLGLDLSEIRKVRNYMKSSILRDIKNTKGSSNGLNTPNFNINTPNMNTTPNFNIPK